MELQTPELAYTPQIAAATAGLYARVAKVVPEVEWPVHAPYVAAINRLKRPAANAPPPAPSKTEALLQDIKDLLAKK